MHKILSFAMIILVNSCAFHLGNIPIIVKKNEGEVIDYDKISKLKESKLKSDLGEDCLQVFLLFFTKLGPDLDEAMKKNCSNSNYSFDNRFEDYVYYFGLYGKECLRVYANCPQI